MIAGADMPDLLARLADLRGDEVALEQVPRGRTVSYAELDRRSAQAASLLADRGIVAGERVAILCRNRVEFFELLFAGARLGAILVPLNWRMTAKELAPVVADCDPALIVCGKEDESLAAEIIGSRPLLHLDRDYEDGLRTARQVPARASWPADDIWFLIYTSGTTGQPKGVVYTFGMVLANLINIGSAIGITASDTTVNFLPLFHTAGINLHTLPTLLSGGRVLVLEKFDAEELVRLIEARRVDTLFAVPTVYRDLLDHPRFAAAPLQHIRHWSSGGAPLPRAITERFRALGVRLCSGMGMTETGPTAFLQQPANAWTHIGSVGKPQLLCGVRLVRADGSDAAAGEVGEIFFSGPAVTPHYWGGEPLGGWFRSGDLARRDDDGFYYVIGRRADMYISGGEHVHPAEVEAALVEHESVEEAAVIAVLDEKWGEVGHAFVKLTAPSAAPNLHALEAFCRSRLAAYKVPRRFHVVPDFPRTAAGKIKKHMLTAAH